MMAELPAEAQAKYHSLRKPSLYTLVSTLNRFVSSQAVRRLCGMVVST